MRPLSILSIVGAAPLTIVIPANARDEQAIRKVMADFVNSVNRHERKAFGTVLAEDADFVVITGRYLKGRKEIEIPCWYLGRRRQFQR